MIPNIWKNNKCCIPPTRIIYVYIYICVCACICVWYRSSLCLIMHYIQCFLYNEIQCMYSIVDCITVYGWTWWINFHFTPSCSETMHVKLGLHLPLRRECHDLSQLAQTYRIWPMLQGPNESLSKIHGWTWGKSCGKPCILPTKTGGFLDCFVLTWFLKLKQSRVSW